jgi:hypothetical protein
MAAVAPVTSESRRGPISLLWTVQRSNRRIGLGRLLRSADLKTASKFSAASCTMALWAM